MMKRIIKIKTLLLSIILITACTDDFITLEPQALETETAFFKDFESVEKAVISAYSVLNRQSIFDVYSTVVMGSIASDDADVGGIGPTDGIGFQKINTMTHQPSQETFLVTWNYIYRAIYQCNFALDNIPLVLEADREADPEIVSQRIGELKFLRGFYYFKLAQLFGGVPIINQLVNPDAYQTMERASLSETYQFIKADLLEAEERLPLASNRAKIPETEIGRATKGAAQSLLAKVYLFESSYAKNYSGDLRFSGLNEHWDSAFYYCEKVIQSGEYYLVGLEGEKYESEFSAETPGYKYIWTLAGENSPESIFEVQAIYDQDKQWIASRGSIANIFFTVRRFFNSDGTISELGWGFNTPTDDLVAEYETGDPRYKITVLEAGDSVLVYGDKGLGWYEADLFHSETGRMGRKYEVHPDYYWNKPGRHPNDGPSNHKLMRYAELVLNAAEAAYQLGQNGKAIEYINMIRKRARNSGDNPNILPDLTSISMDDIIHERRVELALEGQRFFDLVRWRIADDELNGTVGYEESVDFQPEKHEFYPIPASEITATNNSIKQNQNY